MRKFFLNKSIKEKEIKCEGCSQILWNVAKSNEKEGKIMTREDTLREIREAKDAGNRALLSLRNAQQLLGSAGNWGLVDMLGGGFFTSMIKHSKLNDANQQMEQAKYQLQSFQKELQDINVPGNFGVNVSDFLVFADFFFDGLIADWMVQSKIGDAKMQVNEAIDRIQRVMNDLDSWERQVGGM